MIRNGLWKFSVWQSRKSLPARQLRLPTSPVPLLTRPHVPQSGVLLGEALANNHTLEWLDLSYNAVGDEGAQAIGASLAVRANILTDSQRTLVRHTSGIQS